MSWFGEKFRDRDTGLFRNKKDIGRTNLSGPFQYSLELKGKNSKKTISRCHHSCPFCHGSEPGCFSTSRTQKKITKYEASILSAETKLIQFNEKSMRNVQFFQTLASLYHLRTFTFRFGNPSRVFFSLYKQNLTVVRHPRYPKISIAFQNKIDSKPFLTWKKEGKYVVLSKRQKRKLLCLGGISKILAARFFINHSFYSPYMFRRFFGKNSIFCLFQAGGFSLIEEYKTFPEYCSTYYFNEWSNILEKSLCRSIYYSDK
jgi:hypothetical protein